MLPLLAVGMVGAAGSLAGNIGGALINAKANKRASKQSAIDNQRMLDEQRYEYDRSQKANEEQFGKTFADKQAMDAARKQAFEQMQATGGTQMAGGEGQLMSETASGLSPELQQMQQDIAAGTTEGIARGTGEMQAGLAQQGVRGGQAATQLRRGVGEMRTAGMRDVNALAAEDAQRKQAIRAAYLQNKALTGQQATLSPATY